ncbi:hypothetical protein [Synechococcus lacustris]|uniref:hypothetical protein n=1 Tax=Synechococcus lacustris TaxID=2116544 RepID=UPI0020CF28BF|nr:hypothetical protein [Synechococcus lacustris]
MDGAQVVIKSSFTLREDRHAYAKALVTAGGGLRCLALDRAEQREIQLLAVVFGGQNHQRRMLVRLLQNSSQV